MLNCPTSTLDFNRNEGAVMQFGFTIKPDMTVDRILALMATNTKKLRLGTCVTNPATRDITVTSSLFATLNLISGGRMDLGIGRGDSSRRVLGKKPVTSSNLEESVQT